MLLPTIIMVVLACVMLLIGYFRGEGQHVIGLKNSFQMLISILPLLFAAFIVAGMTQSLISQEVLSRWVGNESGFRGIMIGTIAGALTPGGPFVTLPVVAALFKGGAGVGTLVAYMTGWSLISINRLPMEVGLLGWKFTLVRMACTFMFAPLAGLIANLLFRNIDIG